MENANEKLEKQNMQVSRAESLQGDTQQLLTEFRDENVKLKNDVGWLANSAKNSKMQAEKALNDLEEYSQVLQQLEGKLITTQQERDKKSEEVAELQSCL